MIDEPLQADKPFVFNYPLRELPPRLEVRALVRGDVFFARPVGDKWVHEPAYGPSGTYVAQENLSDVIAALLHITGTTSLDRAQAHARVALGKLGVAP